MNASNTTNTVFGVDRAVIEAAIVKGRHERAMAIKAMIQGLFDRPDAHPTDAASAARGTSTPAHC